MSRLGLQQVRILALLGAPHMLLMNPDKVSASLVARGLLKEERAGGACGITPAGLRALATEMEAGRVDDAFELARKERERREAKKKAREEVSA